MLTGLPSIMDNKNNDNKIYSLISTSVQKLEENMEDVLDFCFIVESLIDNANITYNFHIDETLTLDVSNYWIVIFDLYHPEYDDDISIVASYKVETDYITLDIDPDVYDVSTWLTTKELEDNGIEYFAETCTDPVSGEDVEYINVTNPIGIYIDPRCPLSIIISSKYINNHDLGYSSIEEITHHVMGTLKTIFMERGPSIKLVSIDGKLVNGND